jgi:hypothetical protein
VRASGYKSAIVVDGSGTGEQEAFGFGVGFLERYAAKVIEPVEDFATEPLVVGVIAGVVQ